MGCESSAEQAVKFSLITDYIDYLRLKTENQSTNALIFHQCQKILQTFNERTNISSHNSPCCVLEISFNFMKQKKSWGTCSMINPIFALTSAMNVYFIKQKAYANLNIIMNGSNRKSIGVKKIFVPDSFRQGKLFQDYALLVLEQPLWEAGFYGLTYVSDLEIQSMLVSLLTFPVGKNQGGKYYYEMKGFKGLFDQIDQQNGAAIHEITAEPGTTGGGYFILKQKKPYIVAIQSRKDNVINKCYSILITKPRFLQILQWGKQVMTKEFQREIMNQINFRAIELELTQ